MTSTWYRRPATTDADGTRQNTLLFPQGVSASMTLPDGSNTVSPFIALAAVSAAAAAFAACRPRTSRGGIRSTMVHDLVPLRRCRVLPKEKCLYYDIGKCVAPCIAACTDEEYDLLVGEVKDLLAGRSAHLVSRVREAGHPPRQALAVPQRVAGHAPPGSVDADVDRRDAIDAGEAVLRVHRGEDRRELVAQVLSGAGYAVVFANPRGSSGYTDAWSGATSRTAP